jgi:hypothetical protein
MNVAFKGKEWMTAHTLKPRSASQGSLPTFVDFLILYAILEGRVVIVR